MNDEVMNGLKQAEELLSELDEVLVGKPAAVIMLSLSMLVGQLLQCHTVGSKEDGLAAFVASIRSEAAMRSLS